MTHRQFTDGRRPRAAASDFGLNGSLTLRHWPSRSLVLRRSSLVQASSEAGMLSLQHQLEPQLELLLVLQVEVEGGLRIPTHC